MALLTITVAVLVLGHAKQEACIRWWGMLLQFLGIVMVVRDLRGAQQQFMQDSVWERVRKVWARRPGQGTTLVIHSAHHKMTGHAPRVVQRAPIVAAASVESRLAALEGNVLQMDSELQSAEERHNKEVEARGRAIDEEAAARTAADQDLRKDLTELATGSYGFSMFGVVWLAVGLVLSSASPELARWLGMVR